MGGIADALRRELTQPEFSQGYVESFLNSYIATQIKVIREQRCMTQAQLAEAVGTTQTGISRVENVNYAGWSIGMLKRLASAFELRLHVSFEEFGTLPKDVEGFSRASLHRTKRSEDPHLDHEAALTPDEEARVETLIKRADGKKREEDHPVGVDPFVAERNSCRHTALGVGGLGEAVAKKPAQSAQTMGVSRGPNQRTPSARDMAAGR